MGMIDLKQKVAKGAIWMLAEKQSCWMMQFVIDGGFIARAGFDFKV